MLFPISYDLNKTGQDYFNPYKRIKVLGSWCHLLDSIWFVKTNSTSTQIRDHLGSVKKGLSTMSNRYAL